MGLRSQQRCLSVESQQRPSLLLSSRRRRQRLLLPKLLVTLFRPSEVTELLSSGFDTPYIRLFRTLPLNCFAKVEHRHIQHVCMCCWHPYSVAAACGLTAVLCFAILIITIVAYCVSMS